MWLTKLRNFLKNETFVLIMGTYFSNLTFEYLHQNEEMIVDLVK